MIRIILPLFLLCTSVAQARIGETFAQCETRYGPVVERTAAKLGDSDKEACIFSKEGVTITVEYRNGTAWWVSYRLPQPMVDAVLAAIAPDGGWSSSLTINGRQVQVSATTHDQVAVVTYPPKRKDDPATLVVATRAYAKANRADYQAKLSALPEMIKQRHSAQPLKNF